MAAQYSWLDFNSARKQLAQRLYDTGMVFTTDAEIGIYIQQALRQFNVLTNTWKTDFVFNPNQLWNTLANAPGSPRVRTLTDTDAYTQMEYMLLEPPTGGTWTGTPQFSISDLAQALRRRRDEVLQVSNCNQSLMAGIPVTPNTRRTVLPDTVIDVARVRYLPVNDPYGGGYGGTFLPGFTGYTLYRDDTVAQEWYEPPLYQQAPGVPQTFMLSSEPPLTFDVDVPPAQPGTYEAVTLLSGDLFAPPANTLLNIPDDYSWMLIWGALADLLGRESEATDRQRADYCLKRYMDGLTMMLKTPWIMLAKINGVAVNTESIANMDRYMPEWDDGFSSLTPISSGGGGGATTYPIALPVIVTGGIDFFAAPTDGSSVGLTVLANAPIPVADADYVQVSRSNWDAVLDLAQTFACFKMGGAEFQSALELEARAIRACAAENVRLKSTGAFSDILLQRGGEQDRDQQRYNTAPAMQG
jgi:hypothetical protein